MKKKEELSQKEREELISVLKNRFEKNKARHKLIKWEKVEERQISELQISPKNCQPYFVGICHSIFTEYSWKYFC